MGSSHFQQFEAEYVKASVEAACETKYGKAIVLKVSDGSNRVVPIYVGDNEFNGIVLKLQNHQTSRPITYDLVTGMLHSMNMKVNLIRVSELRGNAYIARLHCCTESEEKVLDARPSDAINLALRFGCAILVHKQVVQAAGITIHQFNRNMQTPEEKSETAAPQASAGTGNFNFAADGSLDSRSSRIFDMKLGIAVALAQEKYEEASVLRVGLAKLMSTTPRALMEQEMADAVSDENFELATYLRDALRRGSGV